MNEEDKEEEPKEKTTGPKEPTAAETAGKKVDEEWKAQVARDKERMSRKAAERPQSEEQPLPPATFASFIASLAAQTLIQLGEIENPVSGKRQVDVAGAQYSIDLLSMLKDKSKGNLTQEEERQLDGALFDLRMRFVKASQDASKPEGAGESPAPSPGPAPGKKEDR